MTITQKQEGEFKGFTSYTFKSVLGAVYEMK